MLTWLKCSVPPVILPVFVYIQQSKVASCQLANEMLLMSADFSDSQLRSEVAKQFHRLRAAILRDSEESKRLEELSKQDYPSLKDIPSDAFPLFWTTKQYLRAVDATLPEAPLGAGPFFPRYRLPTVCEEFRVANLAKA